MWNFVRLCTEVLAKPEIMVNWCLMMGLLKNAPNCSQCGDEMVSKTDLT